MAQTLAGVDADRLERSWNPQSDWIRLASAGHGIERAEVHLGELSFEPHRHDAYAIGITTAGVQTFRYRGSRRVCLPGQLHVLHPDETHDGAAGTDDGFAYRILYIAPELVREALGDRPLPFVADPVQTPTPATLPLVALLADIDDPIGELASADAAAGIADALVSLGGRPDGRVPTLDLRAVALVREYLAVHASEQTPVSLLEQVAGTDRFTIARHFRRAYGTSPDRYRTLRRLELARTALQCGESLVRAAADAGFADQSHMSRQFKRTYGLTPARWQALTTRVAPDPALRRSPAQG
jgi:AraC-like DNA-binding protein